MPVTFVTIHFRGHRRTQKTVIPSAPEFHMAAVALELFGGFTVTKEPGAYVETNGARIRSKQETPQQLD